MKGKMKEMPTCEGLQEECQVAKTPVVSWRLVPSRRAILSRILELQSSPHWEWWLPSRREEPNSQGPDFTYTYTQPPTISHS